MQILLTLVPFEVSICVIRIDCAKFLLSLPFNTDTFSGVALLYLYCGTLFYASERGYHQSFGIDCLFETRNNRMFLSGFHCPVY